MIVEWLAKNTGKSVVKSAQAQCQLTIVSSKKITPREAISLIYRALSMEGIAVVESSKFIFIVPEGKEPKMNPELIEATRTNIPVGRQRLIKMFPLKHVQAAEMKERVKGLLSEKATVEVDAHANQIIVTDFNDNLALVGDIIGALDTDQPGDVAVRMIPLKHVSAQELVKEISPLYQKLTSKSQKEMVEITANDRSNSLIILSGETDFKAIQRLVLLLDTEDAQEKATETFQLKNADATDVAKQLKDINQDQDSSSRYPYYIFSGGSSSSKSQKKFNVVADRRRNSIIVQATPSAMAGIAKMVAALDEPVTDESLSPKIYQLKYVSAVDMEDVLNELFLKKKEQQRPYWIYDESPLETPDRDVGRLYGKVRITSEPHANVIILTSNSKESLEAVEAILKQLDVSSSGGESTLRIGLQFAKASVVANSINILFAKNASPPLRAVNQPGQTGVPNQPQQQQQQSSGATRSGFDLEPETKEDGYFPWLGGQPDNVRSGDGRAARPVSDLVGRVRVVADLRGNALLISANVHFFPQVLKLIQELDAPADQVLIEARLVEVASDFLDKLGVRWSPDGSKVFTAEDYDNSILANVTATYMKGFGGNTTVNTPSSSTVAQGLASLRSGVLSSTINMDFLIQFLQKTTDATVLAEPQINIRDNETGRLFVGQEVPIPDNNQAYQGTQNTTIKYKQVGIVLEVTPHINNTGDVELRIHTESSTTVPGVTVLGGAIFDTRDFRTDLTAKNGQTLILGGIIQSQLSDTLRKTPFFGSIPGLKWLFNKSDKTSRRVELMVFLRPRVVRNLEEARGLLLDMGEKFPLVNEWKDGIPPDKRGNKNKTPSDK